TPFYPPPSPPHSRLATGDAGTPSSWGLNQYGQLGNGSSDLNPHPTPARIIDPAPDTTWRAISAGDDHSLGIDSNGHAYSWGNNGYGQLGNGSSGGVNPTPGRVTDPTPNTTWTSISAGGEHSLAIDNHGHAYSWGNNDAGQLGNGSIDSIPHPAPARVTDPAGQPNTTWTSISAGSFYSLALDNHGHAYSWGANSFGELGDGTTTDRNTPVRVKDPADQHGITWTAISAGWQHSLAIDYNGHAYSWGYNEFGQLGNGSNDMNRHPTPARVTDPAGQPNTTWTSISAGYGHSLALDNHGHAYSWGYGGTLGDGTGTYQNTPVRVATPRYTITGVSVGGAAIGAGDRSVNPRTGAWDITLPSHAPGRVDVTVTYRYEGLDANNNVIASNLTTTGTVTLHYTYATQYTVRFSLGDAAGHTSSPTPADQTVYSDDPKPITWPQDPEWEHHWLTGWAKADGSSWDFNTPVTSNMTLTAQWQAWQFTLNPASGPDTGGNTLHITPPPNPPLPHFTQISAGAYHTLAIGSDGSTYAWGYNDHGELGDGTTTSWRNTPVRVHTPAGVRFTQVSAGNNYSLAIGDDGHAYSWGGNGWGNLGNGSSDDNIYTPHPTPARVTDPAADTTWTTLSAGGYHSLAIDSNGHAYSWGRNDSGQLGNGSSGGINPTPARIIDPAANTTWTTISAGDYHSLAIDSNGHAYSWGWNSGGQLGNGSNDRNPHPTPARVTDPAADTKWTTISAGTGHSLAIDNHGHAYSWGWNINGQLGNGSNGTNPPNYDNADKNTPVRVTDPAADTKWTTINAGYNYSLAIDNNGHAYSWGWNRSGQLGDNSNGTNPPNYDNADKHTPVRVHDPAPNTTWTTISAGWGHSLAMDSNAHAYSWGSNNAGQLGDNSNGTNPPNYDNADKHTPVPAGLRTIAVTGITLDRNDATPPPAWNTGSHTWDTTAPAHPDGQVTANIHWTLGGQPQPDYPLTYTYTHQYTLPKAGSIPIQRLSGGTLLLLTTLAALTTTAHQHARRHQPGRHTTISA
ncbi:RCC1 domain-containing protein, partial [Bifidobacterium xylocopae]